MAGFHDGVRRDADRLLPGGGETGQLVRAAGSFHAPLGPIGDWPQSLRSALSICLGSRFPIVIYWGPSLLTFYNDAYAPILASKHPWALGRPCREVWAEIWDEIGPQLDGVLRTGEATWSDDRLLVLRRHGYLEECYFSFSFSPIRDERGAVGGVFTAVTENTQRVVGQRRLQTLRDLAARSVEAKSVADACRMTAEILGRNPADVPFSLLYLVEQDAARLVGASAIRPGSPGAPERVRLDGDDGVAPWPLRDVVRTRTATVVRDVARRVPGLPGGPWPDAPAEAVVAPIVGRGEGEAAALLVVGTSPRRELDADYRTFFELVAGHAASAIANANAYEAERRRAEALAELDRAKTAFFSNVSHEFRTPLTLLVGPLEDALADVDVPLPASHRVRLDVARRGAIRLLKLVNTLLDFSRIEAGRADAAYEPTDLGTFTAELVSVFRSAVERAGLRLVVECGPLREPVWVDRSMWEKVVFNLLSNAFKFTFDGEIAVAVRERGDHAELEIRDTGVGIPADERPHVFERFHRVRGARARTQEGTGIGLALVQEIVRLHGGSIAVASTLGAGTSFTVRLRLGNAHLPADRLHAERQLASTAIAPEAFVDEALRWVPDGATAAPDVLPPLGAPPLGARDARVLVADDNADMRAYVARLLGAWWTVEVVADGRAALEAARARRPDLVLADVMMPGVDGFGLLRALRADPETRTLPVVLLSARAGEEARVEGLAAGADDYLVKPFSARELVARVGAHLELARLRDQALAERERARSAAEQESRAKDEFLAMLGHELRNPLASIRNAIVTARLDESRGGRALDIASRATEQLSRLIDDLLDVARITRGRIVLRKEPTFVPGILARALESTRDLAAARGHVVHVALPDEPIHADADPVRLEQVLVNLLVNAIKYTDPGGRIDLRVAREGSDVVLAVRDTGVGIPADVLPRVFDLFAQAERSLDRAQGGLGIGLTIVKRLVELHGGRVEARSDGPGHGAEFVVRLPALPPQPEERMPIVGDQPAAARPLRVLIVEDNVDAAESLQTLLELLGHRVDVAHDGATALDFARAHGPEMMLVDIGLPEMDGYEVARRLRRDPAVPPVVLVALTGYGRDEDRRRALAAGFDHHLPKPVDLAKLRDVMDGVVGAAGAETTAD